jgi:23S rRNA (cytosine1962-C5)-methyltransferase
MTFVFLRVRMTERSLTGSTEPSALLSRAAALRAEVRAVTNAYRLVDDAADGCPNMTVDCYADWAVLSLYDSSADARLEAIAGALTHGFARGVYVKRHVRGDQRRRDRADVAPSSPAAGEPAPETVLVDEHGMRLTARLFDGLSTGLFTDQRDNRRLVRELAHDARVLNLFAYTCSFSVAAALGGAAETVSVDLSKRALERGRENLAQNGVSSSDHRLVHEDVLSFVPRALRRGDRYDIVVLDPPSFGTRARKTFSVERDYSALLQQTIELLAPGGRLLAVTNHRKTSLSELRRMAESAALGARRIPVTLRGLEPPSDHRYTVASAPRAKSLLVTVPA